MMTRGIVQHQYNPLLPPPVNTPGSMVTRQAGAPNSNKSIVVVMPVARPNSSPSPSGAPFYLSAPMGGGSYQPNGEFRHGGVGNVSLRRPRVEADLTDTTTWQRPYRFT
jgi:hypothetical protein